MNNIQHQLAVKEATKDKFKTKKTIISRAVPAYPHSPEREYQRVMRAYIKMFNDSLKKHLPEVLEAYRININNDSRFDSFGGFSNDVNRILREISKELEQKIHRFGIQKFIEKIGESTQKLSLREWKRTVKDSLGIDLLDDYYNGSFYAEYLRKWVDDNVLRIKSIDKDCLGEMHDIILDGYLNGKSIRDLKRDIQDAYGVNKRKAELLARDQVGFLNAEITKAQQKDAGCNRYRWSDSHDSRVRECHHALNNTIQSWDDPPEMWYTTKSRGVVYTGRRCHPGEDYCCRCVAIPVFDEETLNIPYKE